MALVQGLRDVYEVELPDDAVQRGGPWGRTDQPIAREALALAGADHFEQRRDEWIARMWELYRAADRKRLAGGAMEGADEVLAWAAGAGNTNALLTGNIEPIAHHQAKLAGAHAYISRLTELGEALAGLATP